MIQKGSYVRLASAPSSRMGTITEELLGEDGKLQFKLHHDERFKDTLPDIYLSAYEFEECVRPTDDEVKQINRLIVRGS
jgi:hypothetical protein